MPAGVPVEAGRDVVPQPAMKVTATISVKNSTATGAAVRGSLCRSFAKPNPASRVASRVERFAAAGHAGNDGGKSGSCWSNGFRRSAEPVRAVVVTVIMVLVPGVTEVGLNFAAAPVGSPVTVNVTGFVRVPPTVAVEIANAAGWPAATVSVGVELETAKSAIVSVRAAEVPPPGNGLNTVTKMAPPLVRSPAGTMAVTCVALTIVVVNATPFHSTTVPAKKFVPVSVSVNAAPPAFAVVGESEPKVGNGSLIVNVIAADTPPPGAEFNTVIAAVPPAAMSMAGTTAVSCVPLTTVVASATPFHFTTVPAKKFVPVSVSVNAALPAVAVVGESEPKVGNGSLIVNVIAADAPPPGAGFNTVIAAVPPAAMSMAGTTAVSCVPLTTVVASATPFHFTTVPATKFVPVSVSVKAAPPAFAVVGESIARTGCGLAVTPVPESSRVCGLSKASSVNVTVALRTPLAEGVNVAVIVQLALTASVAPQVDVSPKSAAFAPPRRIEVMFNVALPLFFNVTICGADVVVSA